MLQGKISSPETPMFHVKHSTIVLARRIGNDVVFRRVGSAHRSLHFDWVSSVRVRFIEMTNQQQAA
jgi:hypothetical protein